MNRIPQVLIGDPPTVLHAASNTSAPSLTAAILFEPGSLNRDHHHDTKHQ